MIALLASRKSLWMISALILALACDVMVSVQAQELGLLLSGTTPRRALDAKVSKAAKQPAMTMKKHMMHMNMGGMEKTQPPQPVVAESVPLANFPQWQAEIGYWVGEYSCEYDLLV